MKSDSHLAIELLQVIEDRRALDKRESDLKEMFKLKMGHLGIDTLSLGGVLISLIQKSRTSLDRKSLVVALGKDTVAQFERTTEYTQVDVKEIESSISKIAA